MHDVTSLTKRLSIVDESISGTSLEDCMLLMQLAGNQFSWCLFDRSRNKYIALCDFRLTPGMHTEELSAIFNTEELLSKTKYHKTAIAIYSSTSSIVPSVLYKKEDAARILGLTFPASANETLCADHIKYADAVNIYTVPDETLNNITEKFGQLTIIHTGTALIEGELARNKNDASPRMTVNVRDDDYDIAITSGGSLIYYNSFAYKTIEDFIYYILFVLEQLKLNPEQTPVRLAGNIEKTSASYMIANKYIRNISFGERLDSYAFSYGFNQLSNHAFYTLLNENLCVS